MLRDLVSFGLRVWQLALMMMGAVWLWQHL